MVVKLNLIAAACENMGIGKNGDLPWRLKTEMEYFTRMTTVTTDKNKRNVVLMGRKTWESIPEKYKPLNNRINFILTKSNLDLEGYDDVYAFNDLEEAVEQLRETKFKQHYENVWVIGGSYVYRETMASKYFYRLYITRIFEKFDCDTFFPPIPDHVEKVSDPMVPTETMEEKGIKFVYEIYQNGSF